MFTGLQTVKEVEVVVAKRPVRLTEKALVCKIEGLEKARKSKLNEAAALKRLIQGLLYEPGYNTEVKRNFEKYNGLVNDAIDVHTLLLKLLTVEEKEKHKLRFKAKLLSVKHENMENADDKITPLDSILTVHSNTSSKENRSTKSSCS